MEIDELIPSWERSLRAQNKSPKTITDYLHAAERFHRWLVTEGEPTDTEGLTRQLVQAYLADLVSTRAPSTAEAHFKWLQQFFKWLVEEDEVDASPMQGVKRPSVPEGLVPVIPDDDLVRLLKACDGRDLKARRDTAIVRLFLDTGVRLGGMASMLVDGLDLDEQTVAIVLKGRGEHVLPFGAKTAQALDRYLRVRRRHPRAHLPYLWLGQRGAFGHAGIAAMIGRRAEQAGIGHIHPHQFRHTHAHVWLNSDGGETDLMTLMGWKSRDMLGRYAKSAAQQRARDAHRRMGLGDRL